MYTKCRLAGLKVKKEDMTLILLKLDEEGVRQRQAHHLTRRAYFSKGPNHLWHLDSYDKLKPFGICINGCIDGFSHKIIWLNAYHTSSDPKLIGGYYIESVTNSGCCPAIVRTDCGTENGHVLQFQQFLREEGVDTFAAGNSIL